MYLHIRIQLLFEVFFWINMQHNDWLIQWQSGQVNWLTIDDGSQPASAPKFGNLKESEEFKYPQPDKAK